MKWKCVDKQLFHSNLAFPWKISLLSSCKLHLLILQQKHFNFKHCFSSFPCFPWIDMFLDWICVIRDFERWNLVNFFCFKFASIVSHLCVWVLCSGENFDVNKGKVAAFVEWCFWSTINELLLKENNWKCSWNWNCCYFYFLNLKNVLKI